MVMQDLRRAGKMVKDASPDPSLLLYRLSSLMSAVSNASTTSKAITNMLLSILDTSSLGVGAERKPEGENKVFRSLCLYVEATLAHRYNDLYRHGAYCPSVSHHTR